MIVGSANSRAVKISRELLAGPTAEPLLFEAFCGKPADGGHFGSTTKLRPGVAATSSWNERLQKLIQGPSALADKGTGGSDSMKISQASSKNDALRRVANRD